MQTEGLPAFLAVWSSLQGLAPATDAAEQAALAGCVARLASLPVLPIAQVVEPLLPFIVSRLCATAGAIEVRVCASIMQILCKHAGQQARMHAANEQKQSLRFVRRIALRWSMHG